ncbi:4-amino-4-deoxychorismate lyase [Frateuria sp. Soil773]|uniref:aminodeoxychorismate lyase n=1 Tax=Frateuria sp. Soil773 TaxID=1736407 RepID=UPI00070116C3|nr:aminodeoxychorismate lyase [Frateuria sp. Soil773]KRE93774.1 4-amino-4-deoxychorismate lyase [Frateuria sp. Soil773]
MAVPGLRMLVDGVAASSVSATDRGLGYGDGLFETIRFRAADAPLWPRHMRRLRESCARLHLPPPDEAVLLGEARTVIAGLAQSVVRITVTRGSGARGYAPPPDARPTRIVAGFALPMLNADDYRHGVRVRLCRLRLAEQPLLAGMKHLNRLEQVLARAEWDDPAVAEGLLCDGHDRVIGATMANLFAVVDGVLVTPALDRCGIAGVARAEILSAQPAARVRELKLGELAQASELFLSSSVRGILPVRELDGRPCAAGPVAHALQLHWRGLGFPMEAE